jgi:ABC-type glycerol-3-phosphate transport system permease component
MTSKEARSLNTTAQATKNDTAEERRRRRKLRAFIRSAVLHLLIFGAAILVGFPFLFMISTSLKTLSEVYTVPMVLFPERPQWDNYVKVWHMLPFARFTMNSLIYAISITTGEFFMGLTAGYAFARLRFPKKDMLFFAVLLTLMIPGHIILIPNFILLHKLNWVNTYQGLIVPQMSSAFTLFMLREHFMSLPDELFDAAKIDGAGYFRQMWQVALPMSKPIASALLLLAFVTHWNAYLWPLVVTNTKNMRTLPIGVQGIRAMLDVPEWQLIMAGATIVIFPLIILFLIGQKQFIEGAVQGALKG